MGLLHGTSGCGKGGKAVFQAQNISVCGHALLKMLPGIQAGTPVSEDLLHVARVLDHYFIATRHPDSFPSDSPMDYFDQILATEAIHAADAIVRFCSDHLG